MAGARGGVPVFRPHGALRRNKGAARVAAALAVAPLALTAMFSGWQAGRAPARLEAAEPVVFVGICPGGRGSSGVARAAGEDETPGGRPVLDGEDPDEDPWRVLLDENGNERQPYRGEETIPMQVDRVEKKRKWLKTLKGKFVPYGPKPWDKHRFTTVTICCLLDAKEATNTKIMTQVYDELRRISGCHPLPMKSKTNDVKLGWRVGMTCGAHVILKKKLMRDFLQRLNTIVLPRIRDFEGLCPTSFDTMGNFLFRIENQEPFKELDELVDDREIVHGFQISIGNNCQTQPDGYKLMREYGFPFGEPRGKRDPRKKEVLYPGQKSNRDKR